MTGPGSRFRALTDDALLKRNVLINLTTFALPAVAALVSMPILARGLGPTGFGLLTFSWAAAGVFSLFDFGLGRALTRLVSVRFAHGHDHEVADLMWSASWILLALTSLVAIVGVVAAPYIVGHFMKVQPQDHNEAVGVIQLLAVAVPFLAHAVALRGVLEAAQKFHLSAQLRVPMGIITYAGPLVALPLGADARVAVGIIVLGRVLYWMAHFFMLGRVVPGLARPRIPHWRCVQELADVGSWIFVSNIVGPVLANVDRIGIAMAFPIAASGWYGTAAEVAGKQLLFSGALQPVFFPALAAAYKSDPDRAVELMWRATKITFIVVFISAFVLAGFSGPLLRVWMRSAYSPVAARVLPWLAIAVFINSVAQVPISALQGAVYAKGVGVMFLVELPLYVGMIVIFSHVWGIVGVAFAFLARVCIDAVGLWWILAARFPASRPVVRRMVAYSIPAVAVLVAAALMAAR